MKSVWQNAVRLNKVSKKHVASQARLAQDQSAVQLAKVQYQQARIAVADQLKNDQWLQRVPRSQKLAANTNLAKAQATVTMDQMMLAQAKTKLQGDQLLSASSPVIQLAQAAMQVAQQQYNAAVQLASVEQQQLTNTTNANNASYQAAIQAAQKAVDQANGQVSVDQAMLSQAQTKLTNEQNPQSSAVTVQQDQAQVSDLQQEWTNAQKQLSVDQSVYASPSILQQDQSSISSLQQQLIGAQNQLALAKQPPAQSATVQQAEASIRVLNQQLAAAKQIAADDAKALSQVQASQSQASLTTIQGALSQAQGNVQVDQALLSQAQAKLAAAQTSQHSAVLLKEDQAAVNLAQQQLTNDQILYGDAQQAVKLSAHPAQLKVFQGKMSLDQAIATEKTDAASWHAAQIKYQVDRAPIGKRGQLANNQATLQAQNNMEQAKLAVLHAKQTMKNSELLAPVRGQVISVKLATGARVFPAQVACTLLPKLKNEVAVGYVSAMQLHHVKIGQAVKITSPDFSGHTQGRVQFIAPVPSQKTHHTNQYALDVTISHMPTKAYTGMILNMNLLLPKVLHVIEIPSRAVVTQHGKLGVYRIQKGQRHFKPVKLGVSSHREVQVLNLALGTKISLPTS